MMGVSLYNEAEVEVRLERSEIKYLPEDYRPYGDIFVNNK